LHSMIAGVPRQDGAIIGHAHIDRIDHQDRRLAARVMSTPHDCTMDEDLGADPEPLGGRGCDSHRRMSQRKLEFGQAKHGQPAQYHASAEQFSRLEQIPLTRLPPARDVTDKGALVKQ